MRRGTRSLLFGAHQFLWHPILVFLAWRRLYGLPSWRELVCILIHDWGYWGKTGIDVADGPTHPEFAAKLAYVLFGDVQYWELCIYHSRHYARDHHVQPSKLCWADKLSLCLDPWWFYLPRTWLSGELAETRTNCVNAGLWPLTMSHREWYRQVQTKLAEMVSTKDPEVLGYIY